MNPDVQYLGAIQDALMVLSHQVLSQCPQAQCQPTGVYPYSQANYCPSYMGQPTGLIPPAPPHEPGQWPQPYSTGEGVTDYSSPCPYADITGSHWDRSRWEGTFPGMTFHGTPSPPNQTTNQPLHFPPTAGDTSSTQDTADWSDHEPSVNHMAYAYSTQPPTEYGPWSDLKNWFRGQFAEQDRHFDPGVAGRERLPVTPVARGGGGGLLGGRRIGTGEGMQGWTVSPEELNRRSFRRTGTGPSASASPGWAVASPGGTGRYVPPPPSARWNQDFDPSNPTAPSRDRYLKIQQKMRGFNDKQKEVWGIGHQIWKNRDAARKGGRSWEAGEWDKKLQRVANWGGWNPKQNDNTMSLRATPSNPSGMSTRPEMHMPGMAWDQPGIKLSRYSDDSPSIYEDDFATPYAAIPRDDFGNVEGIMQSTSHDRFLHGQWGPKPIDQRAVHGCAYAYTDGMYGPTDYDEDIYSFPTLTDARLPPPTTGMVAPSQTAPEDDVRTPRVPRDRYPNLVQASRYEYREAPYPYHYGMGTNGPDGTTLPREHNEFDSWLSTNAGPWDGTDHSFSNQGYNDQSQAGDWDGTIRGTY